MSFATPVPATVITLVATVAKPLFVIALGSCADERDHRRDDDKGTEKMRSPGHFRGVVEGYLRSDIRTLNNV